MLSQFKALNDEKIITIRKIWDISNYENLPNCLLSIDHKLLCQIQWHLICLNICLATYVYTVLTAQVLFTGGRR